MNFFLKSKHWLIFVLSFGIPVIVYMFMMANMMTTMIPTLENMGSNPDPILLQEMMMNQFKWFPLMMFLFMFFLYGWQWAVSVKFQEKIPENLRMNLTRFKILFIIPVVSILLFTLGMSWMFSNMIEITSNPESFNPNGIIAAMPILMLLQFGSMACIIHNMYFTAKTIKLAEVKKKVTFGDFVGEFFLIWFFFIGVWILQLRVNKIFNNDLEEDEEIVLEDNLVL